MTSSVGRASCPMTEDLSVQVLLPPLSCPWARLNPKLLQVPSMTAAPVGVQMGENVSSTVMVLEKP